MCSDKKDLINQYIKVAIPCPLRKTFDYLPATGTKPEDYRIGCRIQAKFGNRQLIGIITGHSSQSQVNKEGLKQLSAPFETDPTLSTSQLTLATWISDYYHHPIGDTFSHFLPSLLKKNTSRNAYDERCWKISDHGLGLPDDGLKRAPKQQALLQALRQRKDEWLCDDALKIDGHTTQTALALYKKNLLEQSKAPSTPTHCSSIIKGTGTEQALLLNQEQQQALNMINNVEQSFATVLLEGITGSGKTEVYLQAIAKVLVAGRQVIVLVPEIGLTPQTVNRFASRFDCQLSLFHSGLNDKERLAAWNAAESGESSIVIGTRSALFTPLAKPGLIIVDEEHDGSFKQQDGLRYLARDVAVMRGRIESVPVILGSATPSLESLNNAITKKYLHCKLTQRAGSATLPTIEFIDIRNQPLHEGLSDTSIAAITKALSAGQQVMVFINRRGFAPLLMCHDCGWQANCDHCDAKLTLHVGAKKLRCHHCELIKPLPHSCSRCMSKRLQYIGQGTERASDALSKLFPGTKVIRIDRDTVKTKEAFSAHLNQINSNESLIVVGTQMLAKGHHFLALNTVIILDIDQGLYNPDFRATEKTLQLLTQVTGRAGRGKQQGHILIQTHLPDHPLIQEWSQLGYQSVAEQLLKERQQRGLPPHCFLALLRSDSTTPGQAIHFLQQIRQQLVATHDVEKNCIGPLPAAMEKRAGRHRAQLILTSSTRKSLHGLIDVSLNMLESSPKPSGLRWSIDVDPQD